MTLTGFRSLLRPLGALIAAAAAGRAADSHSIYADVVIVGAGISGLSAALEAARHGATVHVLDMASVFGGHAVMAEGGVSIVDSPMHRAAGLKDSVEQGYRDFVTWGKDLNEAWARHYVENASTEVFAWLRRLGVEFAEIRVTPGNSVPRFHVAVGRGLGLVGPIYRACLDQPNITFTWNTQVTRLHVAEGRISGLETKHTRSGSVDQFSARAVILATGGFQSNLALLREHWSKDFDFPARLLLGSGKYSTGLGHALAQDAGAQFMHLDYHWVYPFGLPDPRDPTGRRGLNSRNTAALWVNAHGRRFVNEIISPNLSLPEVLRQPGGTYWAIFDEGAKRYFWISGTDWREFATIERLIFSNANVVKSASTLTALAEVVGLPVQALKETIARYNEFVSLGDDSDYGRFGPSSEQFRGKTVQVQTPPRRIEQPPFYSVQYFPLTRKNNGGVKVDLSCRVLASGDTPISGLYAVGELTGSGGMNGKAALEGVWLGPGVLMGRVAGKAAATAGTGRTNNASPSGTAIAAPIVAEAKNCIDCHRMDELLTTPRAGYWHFEKVHGAVRQTQQACVDCHSEMAPTPSRAHRVNPLVRAASCSSCHGQR